jgi:DNA-binding NarL/FixJ family response regulator
MLILATSQSSSSFSERRTWVRPEKAGVGMSSVRVLVVEDYEPFRQFVCSSLEKRPELQIVGEVSDGLEAVQKAEELQPDLIVLDIGLPSLTGIEAARRIRELSPQSRILFVSQETSVHVVRGALGEGAKGYVVKKDARRELLTAVDAVLRGRQFVGRRFSGHDFAGASDARVSEGDPNTGNSAPLQQEAEIARCHEVGFYSEDTRFLDDLTQFVGAALNTGNAAIVVATESHRDSLLSRLEAHGVDIAAAIGQGRYISVDAADALSTFMVNGMPDSVLFLKLFGDLILAAAQAANTEQARVAVFGECVHLLWAEAKAEAVIRLEHLSGEIAKSYDVDILCGYYPGTVHGGMDSQIFQRICAEHSAVYSR